MTENWWIFPAILATWNLITFLIMGIDKAKAKREKRRIPESTLLFMAFAFGAPGILIGMPVFHHKTRKPLFFIGVPLCLAINVLAVFGAYQIF